MDREEDAKTNATCVGRRSFSYLPLDPPARSAGHPSPERSAISAPPRSLRENEGSLFSVRREVAFARLDAQVFRVAAADFDFDLPPAAVGGRVRGHVPEAVLRADLRED